ncbi:hypothetical protein HU200_050575 [Digitaria exilis]|uniref:Glycosyltransferase n=1 Tax=Digitaria exilis TaxID=1010633 RepID=A0A835ARF9_9POAL|nr:hypothetical protein HU200_050575 [Digitaria exilis]CAB3446245.1 unnamed protein product [Digitaria exilis]
MESLTSSGAAAASSPRPHVVLLASPGIGHLIPLAELARRLVAHHGLAATLVTFTDPSENSASAILSSLRAAEVATVSLDDLPIDAAFKVDFADQIRRSIPHLRALLHSISFSSGAPLAALVPDFFCYEALHLADELGVPGYIFYPTSLAAHVVMRRHVAVNGAATAAGEYHDLPDPLRLSDHVSLRRADIPGGFQDRTNPRFALLLDMGRRYRAAAGFLMESTNADEVKQDDDTLPPAYMVGPLVRLSDSDEDGGAAACLALEWLDHQPTGSVVYVSFGSGGSLSVEQMAELAAGIEDSGHRFLWVVRMPSLKGPYGMEMESNNEGKDKLQDPLVWLPDGFMERTNGRGLVVPSWAPQVRVLSHRATAAFVSHCGWNSAQESMAAGVPMIAWPMYAEQRMNAAILSENVGVALRLRERPDDGLIPREEIATALREVMEGEKGRAMRGRARDVQEAAAQAWAPEGSSRRKLEELAGEWKATALGRQKH